MKKILFGAALCFSSFAFGQFNVIVDAPQNSTDKETYLYTLSGSKDILVSKITNKSNAFSYKFPTTYHGMMKLYFPESNYTVNFISENKDVKLHLINSGGKISDIEYSDQANILMRQIQGFEEKKSKILPALLQIKTFYEPGSEFVTSLDKEITRLSGENMVIGNEYPFIKYFSETTSKYLGQNKPSLDELSGFLVKSNQYLETSSLLRPLLLTYLNTPGDGNITDLTDKLLAAVNVETPRGQTILSEMIDIFDAYGMTELKKEYLSKASNLKCTITERLAETIQKNKDMEVGSTFKNYTFKNAHNTLAKSIADVKADKKIIVFWSSTCSHCEEELPQLLEKYKQLKSQNIEVIGLSVDIDKKSYENKVASLPWINDAELKGWDSSYADIYNVHATPTYFILDSKNKILATPEHATDVLDFFKLK